MSEQSLFINCVWVIENNCHDRISIRKNADERYWISAWAENWDELWSWESEITRQELESVIANPLKAHQLMRTERYWFVSPPSSVRREAYFKDGLLDYRDGFMDSGRGGKW